MALWSGCREHPPPLLLPSPSQTKRWLQHGMNVDVVLHLGMHGTVEWLPGAPLGNTGLSWSDVLLG